MDKIHIKIPKGLEIDLEKSSLKDGVIIFKEKEVTEVKTWEELKNIEGSYIDAYSCIISLRMKTEEKNKNLFPTKEDAESSLALAQLLQLRKIVVGDWIPDWSFDTNKYVIRRYGNILDVCIHATTYNILSFENISQANNFKENHEELLKTYFQIK